MLSDSLDIWFIAFLWMIIDKGCLCGVVIIDPDINIKAILYIFFIFLFFQKIVLSGYAQQRMALIPYNTKRNV